MKKCSFCSEEIQDEAIKCRHCKSNLVATETVQQSIASGVPRCQACGGEMKKSKESKSSASGCIVLIIGLICLVFFPIGTIIGIILILVGLSYATKKRGLWVCKGCGSQIERKISWFELG